LRGATACRLYLFILYFRNLQAGFHVTNRDILQKRTRSPIAKVRQAACNAGCTPRCRSCGPQTGYHDPSPARTLGLTNGLTRANARFPETASLTCGVIFLDAKFA